MRTLACAAVAAALLVSTVSAVRADPAPLEISMRRAFVRPGQGIAARIAWDPGDGTFVQGTWTADWKLEDGEGRVVANGRRPVRIGWPDSDRKPYRFTVRGRVPRGLERGTLVLSVLVHDGTNGSLSDFRAEAEASLPLLVAPRGATVFETLSFEGRIARGGPGGRVPVLVSPEPWNEALPSGALHGAGASAIVRNPAYDGARVRLTLRGLWERDRAYFAWPPLEATSVEWIDPPAERLEQVVVGGAYSATVPLRSRIPPIDLVGDLLGWREQLERTREPAVLRSVEEFDAFADRLRAARREGYDPFPSFRATDFSAYDVVAVFTGTTPDGGWRVAPLSEHRDEAAQTTWIRYAVLGPDRGRAQAPSLSDACCVYRIPKRPGSVRFERTESVPRPPSWW